MRHAAIILALLLLLPATVFATITGYTNSASFTCAGSVGPYPFTFPAYDDGSLEIIETVISTGSSTTLPTTAYTIVPVNNSLENGGSVTLNTACPIGYKLTIQRDTEETQLNSFTNNMPTLYKTFENSLDKLTMEIQDNTHGGLTATSIGSPSNPVCTTAAGIVGQVEVWNGTQFCVSLLSTSELSDFTDIGVTNGDCPVWNATTGKWTPGPCGSGGPYIIAATFGGEPGSGTPLILHPAAINFTIPTGCTNSSLQAEVPPTEDAVFTLNVCTGAGFTSCSQFATATIAANTANATFSCSSPQTVTAGTALTLIAPATSDLTLADVGVTIYATR